MACAIGVINVEGSNVATRGEYIDPVNDDITFIPADFPDYKAFQGAEYYDYYAVNRWFLNHPRLRASRWGYCVGCIHFTPDILEQTCQHERTSFTGENCREP